MWVGQSCLRMYRWKTFGDYQGANSLSFSDLYRCSEIQPIKIEST